MAHKLTDITPSYHSFAKDQVLTELQLNEFLEYFDEQDRLSRICLSGVGIVCGFKVSADATTHEITITPGAGVTTDGDLIHFTKKAEKIKKNEKEKIKLETNPIIYKYFRPYVGEKVNYDPHFNKLDSLSEFEIIPLIEIDFKEQEGDKNLVELTLTDLENKIVLLYLESYEVEPDNCVGIDCESQGIEQVNRLRVLLVDKEDIGRITKNDDLFNSYITIESYLETKTVYVPRVILDEDNTANLGSLAQEYQTGQLLNNSVRDLKLGVTAILQGLGRASEANNFDKDLQRLFPPVKTNNLVLFQYKYDLLKDLADSFNELKELFLQNDKACCPSIAAFPKHLLLGSPLFNTSANSIDSASTEIPHRHRFHKSPILLDNDDGNKRFESVLTRMLRMVKDYYERPRFVNEPIRITPSNVRMPLGKRAVPFYYKFSEGLMRNWDFEKQGFDRYKSILGYRQALTYPTNPYVAVPLRFSIDPYNFFRIEGHQGKLYDDAFQELTDLKERFSLPFDIKVLGINVDEFDELLADQYKCDFKDLEVLLQAWSSEQQCIAQEVNYVLSSFSTKTPGKNIVEDRFYTIKGTAIDIPSKAVITENDSALSMEKAAFRMAAPMTNDTTGANSGISSGFSSTTSSVQSGKTSYENPVLSYINNEPDTVGYYFNQSLVSANGNYSNALEYTLNTLGPLVQEWESVEVADSTVNLPLKIMASTTSLSGLVPSSIALLSDSTLETYNVEIAKLCSYTKQLQSKYRNPVLETRVTDKTRSMVSLLINQLTAICCSSKKLQALLEEVEKRKEAIISRLNFADFALNNPGLEHQAGAGPGHTFVLVYLNRTIGGTKTGSVVSNTKSNLLANNATTRLTLTEDTDTSTQFSKRTSNLFSDNFNSDQLLNQDFTTVDDTIIRKGTIIADFTLPYVCCSDCAPISFVLPNIPVSLNLSSDTYCIDNPNPEIDLIISPEDGVVTVVDAVPGVNILDGKLSIDGTIFPEELYGTMLHFKVDGENTDAELLVSRIPNVDFTFPDPEANRVVSFTVSGDDNPGFTYHWDFGDGLESDEREPTHDYSDSGSRTNFVVTLTVQSVGGICPKVISHSITFIDVTVSIDDTPVCENASPIPFAITPAGASADIQGSGVNPDKTHFDPSLVGPGNYPLSFEGNIFAVMTVNPVPVITSKILWKKTADSIEFSIESNDAAGYQWTATLPDGNTRTSKKQLFSVALTTIAEFSAGDEITISVTIKNPCGDDSTEETWTVPDQADPTASLEKLRYCSDDPEVYDIATENFTPNTILEGLGVDSTVQPPTFTPDGLPPGEHDIIVDSKVVDTVIIVQKPVFIIEEVSSTSNGFVAIGTVPPGIDVTTLVWKFLHPTTGEELHAAITGGTSVEVNFSGFVNDDWSELIVELSADTVPCGLVSISATFVKPAVEVTIALPQDVYCENDTRLYPFIFTPNTEGVTVTGNASNGVVAGGTQFTPESYTPGNHTLTGSNGYIISFSVIPQRSVSIGAIQEVDGGITTQVFLSPGVQLGSVKWDVFDAITGDFLLGSIPAIDANGEKSPILNLKFEGLANDSWTELKISVSAEGGPCGVLSDDAFYSRPTKQPCKDLLIQELARIKSVEPTNERVQLLLTSNEQEVLINLRTMIDAMLGDPDGVISGQFNENIVNRLFLLIAFLATKIVEAEKKNNRAKVDLLSEFYVMCVDVYAAAFLCQGEVDFTKLTNGVDLNAAFISHFTASNVDSFPANEVVLINQLNAVRIGNMIDGQDLGVEPWKTIAFIIGINLPAKF